MLSRREMIKLMGLAGLGLSLNPGLILPQLKGSMLKRKIYSSGEMLPVVGLGTWLTFDVNSNSPEISNLKEVLKLMKKYGGRVIDSSPMYGNSEKLIGELTSELKLQDDFFYATKVWTSGRSSGIDQMNSSIRKMKRNKMDLIQVHNLIDWRTHLETLTEWKAQGKIKYIGITHYVGSAYPQLESIIKTEEIDFVQFNFSIDSREAENRLLPAAKDNGTAVLVNRPYGGGGLFSRTKGKQLPAWAADYGIESWEQYFLKFIIAHPSVTCVIPGTSNPKHLVDNMKSGFGKMPDMKMREKMYKHFLTL